MKMSFDEFKEEIAARIKEYLPEEFSNHDVSLETVIKNNDTILDALIIRDDATNMSPSIYLQSFYQEFRQGTSMEDILDQIAQVRVETDVKERFDTERVMNYENVKDHIMPHLVNRDSNKDLLASVPHTDVANDLTVTYHINMDITEDGIASARITNEMMEYYGVSLEELHVTALHNDKVGRELNFRTLNDTMIELMAEEMSRETGIPFEECCATLADMSPIENEGMYVLTSSDRLFGASAILNPDVMDMIVDQLGPDYYILPSSIHEVIVLKNTDVMTLADMEAMVQEINQSEVAPEERLSDHVYRYDNKSKEIYRADLAAEHMLAKEAAALAVVKAQKTKGNKGKAQFEKQAAKEAAQKESDRPSLRKRLNEMRQESKERDQAAKDKKRENPELGKAEKAKVPGKKNRNKGGEAL